MIATVHGVILCQGLWVACRALSQVLKGYAAISPEMAIRLEKVGWSNAKFWLYCQTTCNLAQTRHREDQVQVERFPLQSV